MSKEAGKFLHEELDDDKHTEDEVKAIIELFPESLSQIDKECDLPIQSAESNDKVDSIVSRALLLLPTTSPAGIRDGYFIAIRGKGNIDEDQQERSCIFGCWDDAHSHLQKMKAEGRIIEYDAFEKIDDANRYAFGKKNADDRQSPDIIEAVRSTAPFIGAYQEKHMKIDWYPFSNATLSGLEELPQDVITNIYNYLCGKYLGLGPINDTISIIGMVSKSIYQTCVRYLQEEPVYLSEYPKSIKTLAFLLRNAPKMKTFKRGLCRSLSDRIAGWLVLKHFDLSALESLNIEYISEYKPSVTAEDKWKLVEDEVVSVHDVIELSKKSEDDMHREHSQCLAASGLPSLNKIIMEVTSKSFEIYKSLFLCTIDRLVDLNLYYNYASDADSGTPDDNFESGVAADKKAALKKIEQLVCIAPRLRTLTLSSGWHGAILYFKIQSESLESLSFMPYDHEEPPQIQALAINCPALTTLQMPIILDVFDLNQFITTKNHGLIEVMHVSIERLHLRHTEEETLKRKQVFEMLGQMSSLKELRIDDICDESSLSDVYLFLPSIEVLKISSKSLENIIHRSTSLKTLELDMQHLINFKNFHFNLETVKSLSITVRDDEEADDAILATLSQTIEQRMPKLEYVSLDFWCMDNGLLESTGWIDNLYNVMTKHPTATTFLFEGNRGWQ
uniref:Uncharacterized protein n=1 Tax=Chaetoceros debilis TaxID=122233 RepID=A0A7S3Q8J0_9STRA